MRHLARPLVQIIREADCVGIETNYVHSVPKARTSNGTYFPCQDCTYTRYPRGKLVTVFLTPGSCVVLHGKPINILFIISGKTEASFYFSTAGEGSRGATTIRTEIGLQEVQHSQLSNHIKEVMTLVQQSTAMLQTQRFPGCGCPPKPQGLDLRTAERGGTCSS